MGRVLWKYKSESALPLSERQPVCADGINDGNMAAMRTAKERERIEKPGTAGTRDGSGM